MLIVLAWPARASAQTSQVDLRDALRAAFHKPPPSGNGSPDETVRTLLPTLTYNPAIGVAVGGAMNVAARRSGPDGSLSTFQITAAFTTQKQLLMAARNDLHTAHDAWAVVGDSRFYNAVQTTYGLGSDSPEGAGTAVDYYWTRVAQTLYRRVKGPLQFGVGYQLDYFADITPRDGTSLPDAYPQSATTASGVSAGALVDTRDSSLNANRGVYGRATYYTYPTWLGSDTSWQSVQLEARVFTHLASRRRQVVALWSQVWLTTAGEPPYLNLPSVGWDTYGRTARGYTAGRYRGRDWLYVESEYRFDVLANGFLGGVAFLNASTLSDAKDVFGSWALAGGAGLRVKLDKRHGTNLAMDVSFGRGGSKGVWFGLNEAF